MSIARIKFTSDVQDKMVHMFIPNFELKKQEKYTKHIKKKENTAGRLPHCKLTN